MDNMVKIIQPVGIFDGKQGREILEQMSEFLADGVNIFLIDFQSVTFMDSSGFGALLLILKTLKEKNTRLAICCLNEQIKMILELSNTTNVFEIIADRSAFMQQFTLI
ncbi:STAS domain-containing protein [Tolypothrix sp. FACHB-123]|uniref:STAS domain-containing protein n=1 Tax=Tolypothrix sp. FACHB-123 TaxID=2692868 RepID=UPI0016830F96|nr:STAS domain-containing protein [Tolypothrix sp. FACHB-123]MBD2355793.1 STAS domain-containing protein [Tolypothrix sp. FACHB-123]